MFGYEENNKSNYILLDSNFGNHYLGTGLSKNIYTEKQRKNVSFLGYTLVIILKGKAIFTDEENQKSYLLKAGSFFQRLPNKKYSLRIDPNSDWYKFYVTIPNSLYQLIKETNGLNGNLIVGNIDINSKLIRRFENYLKLFEATDNKHAYKLLQETCSLITSCMNMSKTQLFTSEFLVETSYYFELNCHKRIDLEIYARNNGYSYESFRKKFRYYFGISPYRFLINCRMDKAISLLNNLDHSIKDVATQLGYTTSYEFSKHFKKYFAKTPSEFRKQGF